MFTAKVNYDPRATSRSVAQLKADITTVITGFSASDLNKFQTNS